MRFEGFFGNAALRQRLDAAFAAGKVSHCYLLCGPNGSGKRTLARLMAAAMQCQSADAPCGICPSCRKVFSATHPDVITVDDDEHVFLGVDVARATGSDAFERPNEGKKKIYIIPRGDALNVPAQNALLKILEEPPSYAVFLILTTNEQALLPTVRSRCVRLHLAPIAFEEAKAALHAKFPNESDETLRAAHARAGGFLGQTEALLADADDEKTAAFCSSYAVGDRLGVLALLAGMEKRKRPEVTDTLWQWHALLVQALEAKSGFAAPLPQAAQIARGRTNAQLMRAIQVTSRAADALEQNASVSTVLGWLAGRLI